MLCACAQPGNLESQLSPGWGGSGAAQALPPITDLPARRYSASCQAAYPQSDRYPPIWLIDNLALVSAQNFFISASLLLSFKNPAKQKNPSLSYCYNLATSWSLKTYKYLLLTKWSRLFCYVEKWQNADPILNCSFKENIPPILFLVSVLGWDIHTHSLFVSAS